MQFLDDVGLLLAAKPRKLDAIARAIQTMTLAAPIPWLHSRHIDHIAGVPGRKSQARRATPRQWRAKTRKSGSLATVPISAILLLKSFETLGPNVRDALTLEFTESRLRDDLRQPRPWQVDMKSAMIRPGPALMIRTRSARKIASSISCVMKSTVVPNSLQIFSRFSCIICRV